MHCQTPSSVIGIAISKLLPIHTPLDTILPFCSQCLIAHTACRLVGYIVRQNDNSGSSESVRFSCFVYEADMSGTEVCTALGTAAKFAYEQLMEKKTIEKKRKQETVSKFFSPLIC